MFAVALLPAPVIPTTVSMWEIAISEAGELGSKTMNSITCYYMSLRTNIAGIFWMSRAL